MVYRGKRLICLVLILSLFLPVMAVHGEGALCGEGELSGECFSQQQSRTIQDVSDIPLAEGHYERWIDRVAQLPDYAWELYTWLEDNANAEGALADPTRGEIVNGNYCYTVAVLTGTAEAACDRVDCASKAKELAAEAMYDIFVEAKTYVGVVYDAFDRDHPEVFWLNGTGLYGYAGSYAYGYLDGSVQVDLEVQILFYLKTPSFDVRYDIYQSPDAIKNDIALRDAAVEEILSQCPQEGTVEQLRYLNHVLIQRNGYNSAAAMGWGYAADRSVWECLCALKGGAGIEGPVCEGYSKAFMILCKQLGIPCVLVDGFAKSKADQTPGGHMWNYVCVDGSWYAADVTWNDPFDPDNPMVKVSGYESEDWLLLDADSLVAPKLTFIESHQLENQVGKGGLEFINGPLLHAQLPETTVSIGGTVTSFGSEDAELTIALYIPEETESLQEQYYQGNKVQFTMDQVEAGWYILRLSKPEHASRDYVISAEDASELELKICLLGDINGDGRVNVGDVAKIYAHARGSSLLTDEYQKRCADITGDGKINIGDAARAYAKVKA